MTTFDGNHSMIKSFIVINSSTIKFYKRYVDDTLILTKPSDLKTNILSKFIHFILTLTSKFIPLVRLSTKTLVTLANTYHLYRPGAVERGEFGKILPEVMTPNPPSGGSINYILYTKIKSLQAES
jgi:hypothetical protein